MELLPLDYSIKISRNYFLLAITVSLFCVGLAFWSPGSLALIFGAVFLGLFFSSRTFRWLVFPAVLILNHFLIRNAGIPYMIGGLAIQPVDWTAILLILTVVFKQVLTGSRFWMRTGLEIPIWTFLGVIAISLFNTLDLQAGVVNWGHTVLYFIAFYAMVVDWKDVPLGRIWRGYFFWALLAAGSALWPFFSSGGGRSLGLAGIPLAHSIVPVLCFEVARLSLGGKAKHWWVVATFVMTAIATQTRGVWLSGGVLLAVWFFSGYFLKPFKLLAARRLAPKIIAVLFLLFMLIFLLAPLLGQVEQRAEQLVQHSGTVYLRLFLWGVAWKFFLAHPITGIGMGQFAGAMQQFPEMKNLAVFEWTHGLSAHHQLLSLLAETGLIGGVAFVVLLVCIVQFAWKSVRMARTREELAFGWGLFLIFSVFAISALFAGTWQYEFAFFLALLVLYTRKLESKLRREDER